MKRTSILILCAAVLAVCMVANSAQAGLIVYAADFNSAGGHSGDYVTSADYTNGGLIGQDSWTTQSASANPLTVSGAPTGIVAMANNGQDALANFSQGQTSASIWLSADINLSAAGAAGDYFLHMGNSTVSVFFDRIYAKTSGTGYALGLLTSGSTAASAVYGTVLNFGTSYHIVADYNFVGTTAADDTSHLWVNPSDPIYGDTVGSAYVTGGAGTADATVISSASLRQGGATSAPTLTSIDNIAAAVPEPASLVLIGFGLIGFAGAVRYRRKK